MPKSRIFDIPAVKTKAHIMPTLKSGKRREEELKTKPPHELYDLATIEQMIHLLEEGYSLEIYNIYTTNERWETVLSRHGHSPPFPLKIGFNFSFSARQDESRECALLRNLLQLRESILESKDKALK